jgi:hypothetical protein
MKQFVKALPKTGNFFKYLYKTFPDLSEATLKAGVFVGSNTRKLMFDEDFLLTMTEVEREAWTSFKSVVTKVLGNNKDPEYVTIVANMLQKFKVLGCLMSLKIHFLNSHLNFFSRNSWCSEWGARRTFPPRNLGNGKMIRGSVEC